MTYVARLANGSELGRFETEDGARVAAQRATMEARAGQISISKEIPVATLWAREPTATTASEVRYETAAGIAALREMLLRLSARGSSPRDVLDRLLTEYVKSKARVEAQWRGSGPLGPEMWHAEQGTIRGLESAEVKVLDFGPDGELPAVLVFDPSDLDCDFRPADIAELWIVCRHLAVELDRFRKRIERAEGVT